MSAEIAIQVRESVADKLRLQNPDLPRLGLEKLICSLYRDGVLTQREAMEELGIPGRIAFEALLGRHNLDRECSVADAAAEFATLDRLS